MDLDGCSSLVDHVLKQYAEDKSEITSMNLGGQDGEPVVTLYGGVDVTSGIWTTGPISNDHPDFGWTPVRPRLSGANIIVEVIGALTDSLC